MERVFISLLFAVGFAATAALFAYLHVSHEGPMNARLKAKGLPVSGSISLAYAWCFAAASLAFFVISGAVSG